MPIDDAATESTPSLYSPAGFGTSTMLSFFGGNNVETQVQELKEKQQKQEQILQEERLEYLQAIEELRDGLAQAKEEIRDLKNFCGEKPVDETSDVGSGGVAYYEFSQSMWDAAILCFFPEINFADKCVLVLGIVCNHLLQATLLAVVFFDMLDNPYPEEKIGRLLEWRVDAGHAHDGFDLNTGDSTLSKLCHLGLWNFENMEYEEMYSYLYKPIPGIVLSCLALILWVLTTMVEYRNAVEQALAIFTLPTVRKGQHCILKDNLGKVKVLGIRRSARIAGLLLLSLPRLIVVGLISWVGCQYLAQTPSLSDIVLNAVALAFVLDVDEHLYSVLCTQRIRSILENLQPLPCTETATKIFGTLHFKDIIRYLLTVTIITWSYQKYLVPFHDNVEGAATALCGGVHDFSYRGGTANQPTVWLHDASDFRGTCQGSSYVSTFYQSAKMMNMSAMGEMVSTPPDLSPVRKRVVLNHAFRGGHGGCPPGYILGPPCLEDDPPLAVCQPVPHMLMADLEEKNVVPGAATNHKRCQQFRPELGADTCTTTDDGEACLWTALSNTCESAPPGDFQRKACFNTTSPELSEANMQCMTWSMFNRTSPFYNCRALSMCHGIPTLDCVVMRGKLVLDMRANDMYNGTNWDVQGTFESAQAALVRVTRLSDYQIHVEPAQPAVRHFKGTFLGVEEPIPPPLEPDEDGDYFRIVMDYRIEMCPITFVPERFLLEQAGNLKQELVALSGPKGVKVNETLVRSFFGGSQILSADDLAEETYQWENVLSKRYHSTDSEWRTPPAQ